MTGLEPATSGVTGRVEIQGNQRAFRLWRPEIAARPRGASRSTWNAQRPDAPAEGRPPAPDLWPRAALRRDLQSALDRLSNNLFLALVLQIGRRQAGLPGSVQVRRSKRGGLAHVLLGAVTIVCGHFTMTANHFGDCRG